MGSLLLEGSNSGMTLFEDRPDSHSDPLEERLVKKLRGIAEAQRAPSHLRERIFAEMASERFVERCGVRWDLAAAAGGGALFAAAAAIVIWLAVPTD